MIAIDFQGGQHGNFLEFVCNKFLAGVHTIGIPFNKNGAAHSKQYTENTLFRAWHYFDYQGIRTVPESGKIISIRIEPDDLLPLASVSLLRAGDLNLDNDLLHIDTYNKLNNANYQWVLDSILLNFFHGVIKTSYDAIRDPSWPDISSVEEFNQLPQNIQQECINQHGFRPIKLTKDSPDCPRHILVEFFKIGFRYPEKFGFMAQQKKMWYGPNNNVYYFPYHSFYDTQLFLDQIDAIAIWAELDMRGRQDLESLHHAFLEQQPYKFSKKYCDQIFKDIISGTLSYMPQLDLLQESYLLSQLEIYYDRDHINNLRDFVNPILRSIR